MKMTDQYDAEITHLIVSAGIVAAICVAVMAIWIMRLT